VALADDDEAPLRHLLRLFPRLNHHKRRLILVLATLILIWISSMLIYWHTSKPLKVGQILQSQALKFQMLELALVDLAMVLLAGVLAVGRLAAKVQQL
jgi:ABC-type multidrug transport system fused ATPase/permease subunit